jgi:ParB family transcriptional regulator, chromosome partitioning protein
MTALQLPTSATRLLALAELKPSAFSLAIYGDPSVECADLLESIRRESILVPLVVVADGGRWEVLSGHRRLACARTLGCVEVPCQVRDVPSGAARQRAVLEYNRQRRKTFSQMMREADALEALLGAEARSRRRQNLFQYQEQGVSATVGRKSDDRAGRTDTAVASAIGLGGKDTYRQARVLWRLAESDDIRAVHALAQVDAGTKTINAAYKDLRRRDRFTSGFRPTPYDVWACRHDRAFGIPHPGSIPPGVVAHALHYFSSPQDLVVDPMAGGGTTIDVCQAMGRRCLAYDINPVRPDIQALDIRHGYPVETLGCNLVLLDPPYHSMLAGRYGERGAGDLSLAEWGAFLQNLANVSFQVLKSGGYIALLLANQTEKDLPCSHGYIDHVFLGYQALINARFVPIRRVSCPMDGAYLPQQVRRARADGRMLGQVRDLLVMRKPLETPCEGPAP